MLMKMPLLYYSDGTYTVIDPDSGLRLTHEEVKNIIKCFNQYIDEIDNETIKKWNIKKEIELKKEEEEFFKKLKTRTGNENGYVYFTKTNTGNYKIGITVNLKNRIKSFKAIDKDIKLVYCLFVENPRYVEKIFHEYFKEKHINRELFKLNSKDITNVKNRNIPEEILANIIREEEL